jgi:hypothetical protein
MKRDTLNDYAIVALTEARSNARRGEAMRNGLLSHVWVGVFLFGIINYVIFSTFSFSLFSPNIRGLPFFVVGLLYLLAVGGVAGGIYYLTRSPGAPAGIALGFVILTLTSEGSCTLFTRPGPNYAWVNAAFLYAIVVVIGFIVSVIERIVQRNDPDD